ncbi:MAG: hypothetical protein ACOX43_00190 [Bacilli bacterium]|jgi:hypothetical protein
MKKTKKKFKYRKRPYRFRESKDFFDLEVGLIYPDGDDDEDFRLNPNPNRKDIYLTENQFK